MRKVLIFATVLFLLTGAVGAVIYGLSEKTRIKGEMAAAEAEPEEGIPGDDELKAVDTAIVIAVNTDEKSIVLQTSESGSRYELAYDGRTYFNDEFGSAMTAAQLNAGDIVDVSLSTHSKKLVNLQKSANTFTVRSVEHHSNNENTGVMRLGKENYKLPENLVVIMDGEVGGIEDIIENDIITVTGIGRQALAVHIDKGHGYLKLKGESAFVGGWVEVGNKIIKPISDKMLLLVPEGDYEMHISYKGRGGSKMIHIDRDKETKIDVSDLKDEILQIGEVNFVTDPEDAKLMINGEETNHVLPVKLEYGVYKLEVSRDGYKPIQEFLNVGKPKAEVRITLEDEDGIENNDDDEEDDENTINYVKDKASSSKESESHSSSSSAKKSSSKSSSSNSTSSSSSEKKGKLYIDEPEDVEVYFDGTYKGVTPLHFVKESGTHVVTLRKSGYVTKSYTINISSDSSDETFNFNPLVKSDDKDTDDEEEDDENVGDDEEIAEEVTEDPVEEIGGMTETEEEESEDSEEEKSDEGDTSDSGGEEGASDESNEGSNNDEGGGRSDNDDEGEDDIGIVIEEE